MNDDYEEVSSIQVHYRVLAYQSIIPFRYTLTLEADGIDSGLSVVVWGKGRMRRLGNDILENASQLLEDLDLAQALGERILAERATKEVAEGVRLVKINDTVRLLVDIGPYKKGRVFKVVEVAQNTGYTARGEGVEWSDLTYPIKVVPVSSMPGEPILNIKDGFPLAANEFCPGDKEVE